MSSFDSAIRARFERATAGIEPSLSSRTATLRRARRKRTLNAIVAGGAAATVIFGAIMLTDMRGSTTDRSSEIAGSSESLTPPDGSIEVAAGGQGENIWLLSRSYENDCFMLTTYLNRSQICGDDRALTVQEVSNGEGVFVYGDLSSKVTELEMRVTDARGTELLPVEIIRAPEALRSGPPGVRSTRRYFISSLSEKPLLTVLVAKQDDGRKVTRMVGPSAVMGVETAGAAAACSAGSKAKGRLEVKAHTLSQRIRTAQAKMEPKSRNGKSGKDVTFTFESCESSSTHR